MTFIYDVEPKQQKKRFYTIPKKLKITYGESALITSSEGRIESIHLTIIKKLLKNFLKKRDNKLDFTREKIWFYLNKNFSLQKKSKNSRMGKGKGMFERKLIRIKNNSVVFEFSGISYFRLKALMFKINKKLNLKLVVFFKKKSYNIFCNKNNYNFFLEKYLF